MTLRDAAMRTWSMLNLRLQLSLKTRLLRNINALANCLSKALVTSITRFGFRSSSFAMDICILVR